jgi:hypothetical protein
MHLIPSSLGLSIRVLTLTAALIAHSVALAQTATTVVPANAPAQAAPAARSAVEQRTEHIHLEDNSAVIDEVRVGGATKSIDVKPKGNMPAYQVAPESGERSWKVLGF